MIFLSHNSKDKAIVEPIALKLSAIFGRDNIFYDSWSIQPGDGIIDKMNEGLENFTLFYFFISKNSLNSHMVKLEWQNALIKASNDNIKFIPVRIDNCTVPAILTQILYIDLYTNGFDVALRQIIDVANGVSTYRSKYAYATNMEARTSTICGKEIEIQLLAKYCMEPRPHFLFATPNIQDEISFKAKDCSEYVASFNKGVIGNHNGDNRSNAIYISFPDLLTPDFPLTAVFSALTHNDISITSVWHEDKKDDWKQIPFYVKKND